MKHHEPVIAAGADRYSKVPGALAILLIGSLARGDEREDSDVDLQVVLSQTEFDSRDTTVRTAVVESAAGYDGAYCDVKFGTLEMVRAAADVGDDPVRASFEGARVLWSASGSVNEELFALLPLITQPGAEYWERHATAFLSQALLHGGYFLEQGKKLDNSLLAHHAAVHFATALGRAVLARNQMLFRGPKYLQSLLTRAELSPPGFLGDLQSLLRDPTRFDAIALFDRVQPLVSPGFIRDTAVNDFILDNEWAWYTGIVPPEYR